MAGYFFPIAPRVKRKGSGIDYLLLVEALGRIQGNLKLEIGEDWKPQRSPSWKLCQELIPTLLLR